MLREPNRPAPNSDEITLENSNLKWHTLHCELITPMYGGGVESTKVDEKMPIRVSSIRGQLRFWWRLLAKNKWKITDIAKAETNLWGGMGKGDDDGKASKVLLKIENIQNLQIAPWAKFEKRPNNPNQYKSIPTPERDWADVPYVLFPAQGKKPDSPNQEPPHSVAKAGLNWDLKIAFSPNITSNEQQQAWETVRWWANFGGIGARTRRGLGAVYVKYEHDPMKLSPLTLAEVNQVDGFKWVTRPIVNRREWTVASYQAWREGIEKLKSFRQVNVGRNNNSSRSKWAEPDAIRIITRQSSPEHRQRMTQDDIFPRAIFGLPIIFKFQNDGDRPTDEPAQTSLQPVYNMKAMERMASPLILRPFFNGNGWQASALLLDTSSFENLTLKLKQGNREFDVNYGTISEFSDLTPISENGGGDPLQAFLTYFAR